MSMLTQGTNVYILDPEATGGPEVLAVECPTNVSGISAPRDQIEDTCLDATARSYQPGLMTPGQATIALNLDLRLASHQRILELWQSGTKFDMAVGYNVGSDPDAVPGVDTAGEFDFPDTRGYCLLSQSYIADVPQDLPLNAVVTANVSVQLSGFPEFFPPTP
jgi:hypothetical protein